MLYKRKDRFIKVKHHIETMLWGKPLKDYIEKKQRPPKSKLWSDSPLNGVENE